MEKIKQDIINISKHAGFEEIGFCEIEYFKDLEDRLKEKQRLEYNTAFESQKIEEKVFKNSKFKTAIVFLLSYSKFNPILEDDEVKLSSCALDCDYHIVIRKKLESIKYYLEEKGFLCEVNVDNNIYDERYLAYKSGLGFYGKNHLLINKNLGSLFFIGVVLTDAVFEYNKVDGGNCLNCNKCVESCPTKVLGEKYFNGNKCLSYITQKKNITDDESKYIGSTVYGCDVCINVCPYNNLKDSDNFKYTGIEKINVNEFLNMSEEEYKQKYKNNASYWRGKKTIDRNIKAYIENKLK